jgi:hypothetical protein
MTHETAGVTSSTAFVVVHSPLLLPHSQLNSFFILPFALYPPSHLLRFPRSELNSSIPPRFLYESHSKSSLNLNLNINTILSTDHPMSLDGPFAASDQTPGQTIDACLRRLVDCCAVLYFLCVLCVTYTVHSVSCCRGRSQHH